MTHAFPTLSHYIHTFRICLLLHITTLNWQTSYETFPAETNYLVIFVARYKSKDGSEKQALLNEEDMLWVKLRHKHIAEVSE